jgi:hypothetical protein
MDILEKLKGIIDKNLPVGWDTSVDLPIKPEFGDYSAIINTQNSQD